MVIAVSACIFAIYWAGLIGGENLADEGKVSPFVAMWTPDLLFTALGKEEDAVDSLATVITLDILEDADAAITGADMGRESASQRGGGWDDLIWTFRKAVGSLFRRKPATA